MAHVPKSDLDHYNALVFTLIFGCLQEREQCQHFATIAGHVWRIRARFAQGAAIP